MPSSGQVLPWRHLSGGECGVHARMGAAVIGLASLQATWSRVRPVTPCAIGLDISTDRINLVQFAPHADGPVLSAMASVSCPMARDDLLQQPDALKSLLRRAFDRHGFKGRRVIACLHASELRFFPATFHVAADQDEPAALVADLRARLGDELDTSVVDYLPIRNEDAAPTQRDALVVVAPRARVLAYLSTLERAGLQVDALDVGPAALARLVAHVNQADERTAHPNTLTINFGLHRSHLSVVWGRRLMLDREIEFAQQGLLDRIVRTLGVDETTALRLLLDKGLHPEVCTPGPDAEFARTLAGVLRPDISALVSEVNKTLIYTASRSRGRSVDQIYLLGSVGRYPGVAKLLQEHLSMPIEVLNPFRSFSSKISEDRLRAYEPIAGMALACGLGLRGATPHARD